MQPNLKSLKATLGADSGSDHELLIANFRLKLKKVGKTTRLFRYNLNIIPYDYIAEVANRSFEYIHQICVLKALCLKSLK